LRVDGGRLGMACSTRRGFNLRQGAFMLSVQ
jgi:hypothetical protein